MRKATYCLLFLLITVILIQMPKGPRIIAEASPGDNDVTIEPNDTSITLKKGEYYILKVNITNNGTETLKLKKVDVQRHITQIINTTHPLKWLMPSNKTWALILINTSILEPVTYHGWVNFIFESPLETSCNSVTYSITIQPSNSIIQIDPPYLYYESLSYEESIIKITVKNLIDVNLTVALQIPSKLDEVCIPLKVKDTIPPRGHAEYPILIRSWEIPDIIVEELNFTVISPISQTWRIPIALVPHDALNIQNYTLLEKHAILENNSIIVANGSTTTVNFSIPVGVHQLIINGQANSTELQWKLYNSTNKMVAYMEGDVTEFSIIDPMPGIWSILLNNTGPEPTNITLKVLVSAPDMIGGTDLLKEKLVVQGNLLASEEKIFRFYVPPGVSSLNIFTKESTYFAIELYDPFGKLIETLPLVEPLHGTYTIKVISSNPDTLNELFFFMEIKTPTIDEFGEIPVVITDFIRSGESKIYRFYVPPGIEAFSLYPTANGSFEYILKNPSGEEHQLLVTNFIKDPEHGVWSLYVQAGENITLSIDIDEIIATLLGTPPFQVTGKVREGSLRVFKFYIPHDTETISLNGSSTSQVEWELVDPNGEVQHSSSGMTLEVSLIENPAPGVWKLKIESFEPATFSFETIAGNYSFSQVKVILEQNFLISTGSSENGDLVLQNFGNESLEITNVKSLDSWVNVLGYDPPEIASSSAGSINFEVDAENCTYGIYHSFIVIESNWGTHFAEVSMKVLLDLVKVKETSELLISSDVSSLVFNILVQNIGASTASISNVTPSYPISENVIKTTNVSVIIGQENGFTEGLHYILLNITITFGTSNIMSFFTPIIIVSGRPHTPNFTSIENVHANILQSSINGFIDKPLSISVSITNEANYSTGRVILWSYVTNDFYSLPASITSIENESSTILSTTVRFAKWTKETIRLLLIVENSSGEFVFIVSQNMLSVDIEPGIKVLEVWYLPEEPLVDDYIAVKAKIGETKTSILTVATLYMYDHNREILHMATSEGNNIYGGVLEPFMQPVNVSFITSAVANGRLGFFISDNNGNYYDIKVKTSPPPEEFCITILTSRPAYQSRSKVFIWGNVTREGSLLINVFVNVKVLDPNGEVIAEEQRKTNETGYFTMEVDLTENAVQGVYLVNVTYENIYAVYEFWVDNTPPNIVDIAVIPQKPHVGEEITFEVQVKDNESGVERVILSYNNGSGWVNITMERGEESYLATLSPLENKTVIKYKVYAWDLAGNIVYSEEKELVVLGETKPWSGVSPMVIGVAVAIGAVVIVFLALKKKSKL